MFDYKCKLLYIPNNPFHMYSDISNTVWLLHFNDTQLDLCFGKSW